MNRTTWILLLCASFLSRNVAVADEGEAVRLLLLGDLESRSTSLETSVMKPFEVLLVAERDAEAPQVSTVAFTLSVPEGLLVVGEEVLVEALVALGTPKSGLHLTFHCVESKQVSVYRFRLVAIQPVQAAELRLLPDERVRKDGSVYGFRGVVSCPDENFATWEAEESVFKVTAR
jgi:hypothetical protein